MDINLIFLQVADQFKKKNILPCSKFFDLAHFEIEVISTTRYTLHINWHTTYMYVCTYVQNKTNNNKNKTTKKDINNNN